MMEPTDNAIHAGCLGNINATWTFHGRSGTPRARGWPTTRSRAPRRRDRARRARAGAARLRRARVRRGGLGHADRGRHRHERDPGRGECARELPLRARPHAGGGRGAAAELCDGHGELRIDANAPSGPVARGPLVDALIAAGDLAVAPKQAWTPVAEFGQAGLAAVNFGPGDPPQAHARRVDLGRGAGPAPTASSSVRGA